MAFRGNKTRKLEYLVPDAVNDRVGNIMLSRIMGAEVELFEVGFGSRMESCPPIT